MNLFRFLLLLSAFLALNAYLYVRGRQALPHLTPVIVAYTVLFVLAAFSGFIGIFLGSRLPLFLAKFFEITGGYWMILFVYVVAGALLGDLLRLANHFFPFFPQVATLNPAKTRLFYLLFVLFVLAVISVTGYIRFIHPRITRVECSTGAAPAPEKTLRILVASDLHLGHVIGRKRLAHWIAEMEAQKPDIILLAGDIVDHNYRAVEAEHLDRLLATLEAPLGVYAVPGNHDFYAGIAQVTGFLERSGITVLRDSVAVIKGRLVLAGRDDLTNRRRKPLADLLKGTDRDGLPLVVMDHQPQDGAVQESVDNKADLHVSGHTHNGQVFPYNLIVKKIYQQAYGYFKTGATHVVVSSGLGLWGAPLRLGSLSEMVLITLK